MTSSVLVKLVRDTFPKRGIESNFLRPSESGKENGSSGLGWEWLLGLAHLFWSFLFHYVAI